MGISITQFVIILLFIVIAFSNLPKIIKNIKMNIKLLKKNNKKLK
jgi:Sec-independent protein translocase protein TatA